MAGKRRAEGRPMRRSLRLTHRKKRLAQQLAEAATPQDRVAIAADHYRSALAVHPDPAGAERVVEQLVEAGDRLYRRREGKTRVGDAQ